jgi:hypothetical protein
MPFDGVINRQDYLLTINRRQGEVKNALPGVHVTPCFLDPENGIWVLYAKPRAATSTNPAGRSTRSRLTRAPRASWSSTAQT